MGGGTLGQRRIFQQLFFLHGVVVDAVDLKHALSQSAGLVKHHHLGLGQGLHIVGALDQNALLAGAANTGEEAEGNADHQSAGAADDQEGQGAIDPVSPVSGIAHQHISDGGQHRQQQRGDTDQRRVDLGELGDKVLRLGFPGAGFLYQFQNLGYSRLTKLLGGSDLQNTGHIDAAADDLVIHSGLTGQTFTSQCGGVQGGITLNDDAVNGDFFAGLHHDHSADLHFVRIYLFQLSVPLNIGVVRSNVHESGNVSTALSYGIALEQLTHLIEQHDGDGLVVVAALFIDGQCDGADGGHRHQNVFVKHLAVQDALHGLPQNVIADN